MYVFIALVVSWFLTIIHFYGTKTQLAYCNQVLLDTLVIIENIHPLSFSARISARVPPCTHTSVLGTHQSHTFLPLSLAPIPSNPREGPRDTGPPPHWPPQYPPLVAQSLSRSGYGHEKINILKLQV